MDICIYALITKKVACMERVVKNKVDGMIGTKLTPNNVLVTKHISLVQITFRKIDSIIFFDSSDCKPFKCSGTLFA